MLLCPHNKEHNNIMDQLLTCQLHTRWQTNSWSYMLPTCIDVEIEFISIDTDGLWFESRCYKNLHAVYILKIEITFKSANYILSL